MEDAHHAPTEPHLTAHELAERERVPVGTVYQWNRSRTGPPFMRLGKHVRYRLADVEAWENSRYVGPKTEATGA